MAYEWSEEEGQFVDRETNWPDYADPTSNYHGGNPFSSEAHDSIVGAKQRMRAQIKGYIGAFGPSTCDEVELATGLSHQTTSARITELKADSSIIATGERRMTRTGRMAAVYDLPGRTPTLVSVEAS